MRKLGAPLFVLSHMRSYSSVLAHVLGSHPEIDGYCETHLRYNFRFDVLRLHWRVRKLTGEPLRGRYVLDKILHNYTISPGILEGQRMRAVLLLRQPVDVLQSILHMGTHLDPLDRNTNLEHVGSYYIARLDRLTELARKLGRRAAFVESSSASDSTNSAGGPRSSNPRRCWIARTTRCTSCGITWSCKSHCRSAIAASRKPASRSLATRHPRFTPARSARNARSV